jgi:hypothetical protein
MIPRVKPESMLFGKPVSTLGSSPRTGFFRIMLSVAPIRGHDCRLSSEIGAKADMDQVAVTIAIRDFHEYTPRSPDSAI